MGSFGLVAFTGEDKEELSDSKILKYLPKRIKNLFKRHKSKNEVSKAEFYEDLNLYIYKLPYSKNEVINKNMNIIKKISNDIVKASNEANIGSIILPNIISDKCELSGFKKNIFTGQFQYKALFRSVLNMLYTKQDIKMGSLDFSIIHGNSHEELYTVIKQLLPIVKFITIVTTRKSAIEEELNRIYEETGLSIRVTDDYKGGLRNADIIVNLGDFKESVFNLKFNPKAIILNYGDAAVNNLLSENTIINGIDVKLPNEIVCKLDRIVFDYYNESEIAEMILIHKYNKEDEIYNNPNLFEFAEFIEGEFRKDGYKIKRFLGRRGFLEIEDIRVDRCFEAYN